MVLDVRVNRESMVLIPSVTQKTLAAMIGATRSRVSFFMNRFRKLGYIEYKGRIRVNKSLLNVVLNDQLPEGNSARPTLVGYLPSPTNAAKRAKRACVHRLNAELQVSLTQSVSYLCREYE